ncbi:MAG: hypothetical protein COA94_08545 [Rickettsiales bacterium]|nr:MAG: hypothetical protein COA94_08545 [Rickettsiales bacterium]
MFNLIHKLQITAPGRAYLAFTKFADDYLFSLLILFMRIWMAQIFWYSGLTKISSWKSTLYLFEYEYAVPIIPSELAAILATATELSAPIFLVLGFMTRLVALPMLVMVAVIQFTYLDMREHLYWASFLGVMILRGPGIYSIDCIINHKTKIYKRNSGWSHLKKPK